VRGRAGGQGEWCLGSSGWFSGPVAGKIRGAEVKSLGRALFVAAGVLGAAPVFAADLPTKKPAPIPEPALPSIWTVDLTLYGWALNIDGKSGIGRFPTSPFFVSFDDILRHLDFVVMANAIARNDTFIGGVDLIWARLGTSLTYKDPSSVLFGTQADIKLSVTIATAFGGVRIPIGPPNLQLYGTLGARYFNDGVAITLRTPVFGFEHFTSAHKDWIDPVIGLAAHYRVNDKWFVNAQADIGGLDKSATGQVLGSVGYNWTQNISTTVGYRVMYGYDKDENARGGSFRLQEWI
jgi:hypothetical protein